MQIPSANHRLHRSHLFDSADSIGESLSGGEDLIAMRPLSNWLRFQNTRVTMWALFVCLGLFATGCSSLTEKREKQDLVEAELRAQERHIIELKSELERKEGAIHSLDLEVEKLQQSAAGNRPAGEPIPPGVVKEITLGRLTGGHRMNPRSLYDDSLQFLIEPRDADGHSIKVPGSLHIELFEVTAAGLKVPLSAWDVTHRELRRSWDQPLFGGSAYRVVIPFKALPANERMRVVIRFTTLDGKPYEAEKDFSIRLPGPGSAPMVPMATMPGGYTVVTPGRMINGVLVGPLDPPPATTIPNNPASQLPAPPLPEGTGRTATPPKQEAPKQETPPKLEEKKQAPPAPPMIELNQPADKKVDTLPMPPRNTPANLQLNSEPPPLAPPPDVPQFNRHSSNMEQLPNPSTTARTNQPLYPQAQPVTQAGYQTDSPISLTAAPPANWRTKHLPAPIVEYGGDTSIKLSRPVVVK